MIQKLVEVELANPLTEYPEAERAKTLQELRSDFMLDGNTLRGMLLNVYGWSLIGQIAFYAGIGALVVGILHLPCGVSFPQRIRSSETK